TPSTPAPAGTTCSSAAGWRRSRWRWAFRSTCSRSSTDQSPTAMASSARAEGYAPAPAKRAYQLVTGGDPVRFYPRSGPLPGVGRGEDASGAWDAPGQSRKLVLSDGGTVVERLTEVDAPRVFRYRLTDFTGSFAALVAYAEADWDFVVATPGTR